MRIIALLFTISGSLLFGQFSYAQNQDKPCPVDDCSCILQKADQAAINPKEFKRALDLYFAVTACDGNLRQQAQQGIEALFQHIEQLRVDGETAKQNAQRAQQTANANARAAIKARQNAERQAIISDSLYRVAEVERKKAQEVLNKIYFYQGRIGLAYELGKYGFIDKDLNTKIGFKYDEALPFDYTGFARVKRDNKNFLIDTTGREYLVAIDMEQLTSEMVALDLRNRNLERLPSSIFNHPHLEILLVGGNRLNELPDEIEELQILMSLDISNNQLSRLPPQIGHIQNLSSLYLFSNQLTQIPSEIGQLQNLNKLSLYNNQLDELLSEIGRLQNLSQLDLSQNQLTDLPPEFGELQNLTELSLEGNQLSKLPAEIGHLKKLTSLYLGIFLDGNQ